uniref:Uncharacterized protein n=1 Tax=Anguilla anguilla TaxID=7936 RepID=A0A0E9QQ91_ANGAN
MSLASSPCVVSRNRHTSTPICRKQFHEGKDNSSKLFRKLSLYCTGQQALQKA